MIGAAEPQVRHWLTERAGRFTVIGIAGAQGSGKSTLAQGLAARLMAAGLKVAVLSLDDLYLTRAARAQLAVQVHPLFATRGVPGTHDLGLGFATIDALRRGDAAALPRFDKGRDDRAPESDWPRAAADTQVLLFDGWCLGAASQPEAALLAPINDLEAREDPQGSWRRHANALLAGDYQQLWAQIDRLIFLAAPDWSMIAQWREQQEAELRQNAPRAMAPQHVMRFIQHYERLTRWMLNELPGRADLTLRIGRDRRPLGCGA